MALPGTLGKVLSPLILVGPTGAGKTAAALYFARNVLPGVQHKAELLAEEDKSPLEIADEAFATT